MTGTIKKIDHNTGMVDLKTQEGMALAFHFLPTVIKDLKEGDRGALQMKIAKQLLSTPPATQCKQGIWRFLTTHSDVGHI